MAFGPRFIRFSFRHTHAKPLTEIENEKWYALYKSAMMEFEHSLVAGRIKDTRTEISNRVQELRDDSRLAR